MAKKSLEDIQAMNDRFSLIIQGPLVSSGLSGRSGHKNKNNVSEGDIVTFNCKPNVERIVEDYGSLFSEVILSTWRGELKGWSPPLGVRVVESDPEGLNAEQYFSNDTVDVVNVNNKYKKLYGISKALNCLEFAGGSRHHVLCMRTDEYIDIAEFFRCICEYKGQRHHSDALLFVTHRRDDSAGIGEHYISGDVRAVRSLCDAMLAFRPCELHSSIHKEIWLKNAMVNYFERIGVKAEYYFPTARGMRSSQVRRIWEHQCSYVFRPLSKTLLASMEWRGEPVSDDYMRKKKACTFSEDILGCDDRAPVVAGGFRRSWALPKFLVVDFDKYQRYVDFTKIKRPLAMTLHRWVWLAIRRIKGL